MENSASQFIEDKIILYKKDENVIGVFQTSDAAHQNVANDNDKIIILIITENKTSDYKTVEYINLPPFQIMIKNYDYTFALKKIVDYKDIYLMLDVISSDIVFDKSNHILKTIQYESDEMYYKNNVKISESSKLLTRYKFTDWLNKIENLLNSSQVNNNFSEILHLMNMVYTQIIFEFFKLKNIKIVLEMNLLKMLLEEDKHLYEIVIKYFREDNIEKKYFKLKTMVSRILEPFGGFTPDKWQIPITNTIKNNELMDFSKINI